MKSLILGLAVLLASVAASASVVDIACYLDNRTNMYLSFDTDAKILTYNSTWGGSFISSPQSDAALVASSVAIDDNGTTLHAVGKIANADGLSYETTAEVRMTKATEGNFYLNSIQVTEQGNPVVVPNFVGQLCYVQGIN